jgi:hypothetical protein
VIELMFDVLACPVTSFPTPNPADKAAFIPADQAVFSPADPAAFPPAPSDGSTFADWDVEDRLVDELLASGVLDPDPEEQPMLPPDLEAWPTDFCLAILLDHVDPMSLSDADRVRYVVAAERLTAHTQAAGFSGIGAVAASYRNLGIDDAKDVYDGTAFELGSALRWTRRHAETELDLALDLLEQLPSVLRALSEGRIDRQRAKVIVDGTAHLQSIAHARQVAEEVLDDAARLTTGQLAGRVRRGCLQADPEDLSDPLCKGGGLT